MSMRRHCERSKAIQSARDDDFAPSLCCGPVALDASLAALVWIASLSLAMTAG